MTNNIISNHLFCEFSGPLVTVSTAVITVLHSTEVVHLYPCVVLPIYPG
jgi:hypothetical protein